MPSNQFRLIALKPLEGCSKKLTKILEIGQTYYFYQNCKIQEKTEALVRESNQVPSNFFNSSEKNLQIEVSAIVGKNGSGKSSLIELFMMCINNLAFQYLEPKRDLVFINGLHVVVYFELNGFRKIICEGKNVSSFTFHQAKGSMIRDEDFDFNSFFYTIAVNYSHYAYNELDYAKSQRWLTGLFHKNDGYQAPININPFRINGNIDINTENHLVKARLVANLLRQSRDGSFDYRNISENYRAVFLQLKLDEDKPYRSVYQIDSNEVTIKTLRADHRSRMLEILTDVMRIGSKRISYKRNHLIVDYILYKLMSICVKYEDYREYFDQIEGQFIIDKFQSLIQRLNSDSSHITFKFRQAINFLRFDHLKSSDYKLNLDDFGRKIHNILKNNVERVTEPIELLPPSIFNVEIMLKRTHSNKVIPFRNLSSGEKQWNYSTSSFLYHLNNLDSIFSKRKNTNRINYKSVLIVLEEIELYFHPEMQRRYIKNVLDSILNLHFRSVRSIQIIFVTHSPFILSDLPDSHILFLAEDGNPIAKSYVTRTFGGNIHELLAKSFFLREALVGAFAQFKIKDIISKVQDDNLQMKDVRAIDNLRKEIELIGEDFLREKLLEMFEEKYEPILKLTEKEKRIAELKEELKRLEDDKS